MIDTSTREMFIYDDIGPSWAGMIDAEMVQKGLMDLGSGDVKLRINTYGGSVDQALAMLEILNRHDGEVTVSVDSIAASAGSLFPVVFPSTAAKHARVMIHNPWGIAMGNAKEMRETADVLDLYADSIVSIYAQSMTVPEDEIRTLLDAETWMSAADAKEVGLIDSITEGDEVEAKAVAADRFRNTPKDLIDSKKPTMKVEKESPKRIAAKLRMMKIAAGIRRNRSKV